MNQQTTNHRAGMHLNRTAGVLLLALLTVMYGGVSLLRLLQDGDMLDDWQIDQFRAGHAHAGVLLILALVYLLLLERTRWSMTWRKNAMRVLGFGVILQSGGFFLHMAIGEPETFSAGIAMTFVGALLLAAAVIPLGIALFRVGDGEDTSEAGERVA
jgi:uncharacterized membrane protein YidH (DUF202 family)